jgi:AcrR family transcriptional regulator
MTVEKTEKGDPEIRQRILEAAARLFHSHGYNATGMIELIREANVAKRTFYKHFESKASVLKAYLEAFDEKFYQLAGAQIDSIPDPKQRIPALFDIRARFQKINSFLGCPFVKINAEIGFDDQEVNEIVRDSKSRFKAYIRQLVAAANARQQLSDEELADMIFLLMDGALLSGTIFKSGAELKNAKALTSRFL